MFVLLADMNITYLPCGNVLLFYPPSPYPDGKPRNRTLDRLSNLPQKIGRQKPKTEKNSYGRRIPLAVFLFRLFPQGSAVSFINPLKI